MVKSYKDLGLHLINKLDWADNTNVLYKKRDSRLYLMRRLQSSEVQGVLTLWWQQPSSMVWSAGAAAASRPLTGRDLTGW